MNQVRVYINFVKWGWGLMKFQNCISQFGLCLFGLYIVVEHQDLLNFIIGGTLIITSIISCHVNYKKYKRRKND